jgi:hypothetical protein
MGFKGIRAAGRAIDLGLEPGSFAIDRLRDKPVDRAYQSGRPSGSGGDCGRKLMFCAIDLTYPTRRIQNRSVGIQFF